VTAEAPSAAATATPLHDVIPFAIRVARGQLIATTAKSAMNQGKSRIDMKNGRAVFIRTTGNASSPLFEHT
jgi:hypothetical protein